MTTHHIIIDAASSMEKREGQASGDTEQVILEGRVRRVERSPELGDSGSPRILSRRTLVITLGTGGRWHLNLHMNLLSRID